jgi:phage N-6-adenine-methyltransferase
MVTDEIYLRQEWQTPPDFVAALKKEFAIDIDVAADESNAIVPKFITKKQNSLSTHTSWFLGMDRTAYCNPPFGQMDLWIERAIRETETLGTTALVLGMCAPSTSWWKTAEAFTDEIRLLSPRVQFQPPPGIKKTSNPRECALFVFRGNMKPNCHIWTWYWKQQKEESK